jgi:hypothetical protein
VAVAPGIRDVVPDPQDGLLRGGQQLIVGQMQDGETAALEPLVPPPVSVPSPQVIGAVELDDQARLVAVEVQDVGTNRVLAAELVAQARSAKEGPQDLLRGRGGPADGSSSEDRSADKSGHSWVIGREGRAVASAVTTHCQPCLAPSPSGRGGRGVRV